MKTADPEIPAEPPTETRPRKRRRWRVWFLGFFVVGLIAVLSLAAHPWWLGSVARHILVRQGVSVGAIHTHGFAALELRDLSTDIDGTLVRADRAVVALPIYYLLALWRGTDLLEREPLDGSLVTIEDWVVILSPDPDATAEPGSLPPAELFEEILKITDTVVRFLPTARLGAGEFQANGLVVAVEELIWRKGYLQVAATLPETPAIERLRASVERSGEGFVLEGEARPDGGGSVLFSGEAELAQGVLHFAGETGWGAWRVSGTATWSSADWTPDRAHGRFSGGELPSPVAAFLPQANVEKAEGSFSWEQGEWTARSTGTGEWQEEAPADTLDWSFDLAATGDTQHARIGELHVDLPFLRMALSEPVELTWPEWQLSSATTWTIEADLARLPQYPVDGAFRGIARFAPRNGVTPGAGLDWQIDGELLARMGETAWEPALSGEGSLDQDKATVDRFDVSLPEGTTLSASGAYAFAERTLSDLALEWTLVVSEWAALVRGIELPFARLSGKMQAEGPLTALRHTGEIVATDVHLAPLLPVASTLSWEGVGVETWEATLDLSRETARARTRARATQMEHESWQIQVSALTIEAENGTELLTPHLHLAAPMALTISLADGHPAVTWSSFRLESGDGLIEASGGQYGPGMIETGNLLIEDVDFSWVADWLEESPVPDLRVQTLSLAAGTGAGGQILGQATARVFLASEEYGLEAEIEALPGSIRVDTLRALRTDGELFRLHGTLPLSARRTADGHFTYDLSYRNPLSLEAEVDGDSVLSEWIGELVGIHLDQGTAHLSLRGNLARPSGEVRLRARNLRYQPEGFDDLTFLDPALHVLLDNARMEIVRADFSIHGMAGRADLSGYLERIDWESIFRGDMAAALDPLSGRISLQAFPLAAIAGFLPEILGSRGSLEGAVNLAPGRELTGEVDLRNAALRPFEDGSTLRDIHARLTFAGTEMTFPDMSAQWNGRPARLDGKADLADWPNPTFSIRARGENLDLVRREDLLLRADIDLHIERLRADQPPLIRGDVGLRNSLFLQDFRDLIRPGAAGVETRPPYFRVEDELLRDWRLDVRVTGREFLRLQSTLMRGRVSADFRLSGNLGNPLAIGNVRVSDGALLFPFGRIHLARAEATVTLKQPNSLQLSASGSGQVFGYSLSLFLDGTAERPQLELTSVPSLGQEAILLMLATGALPETEDTDIGSRGSRVALYLGQDFFSLLFGGGAAENIRIRSGDSFSGGGQATAIEYIISDRWSVIGEYNEFEDYNVDLRWRVFRR